MATIREIQEHDAENFLSLCHRLDRESKYMLLEPGERKATLEEQRNRIVEIRSTQNQVVFVAEENGSLVGYLSASGGRFVRNKHSAYIVVGILEQFTSRGIGTAFFQELENWAREQQIHRLELTVMIHNQRGVGLYQKMGFAIEGIKKESLLVDGSYVDEYFMAKLMGER